MSLLHSREQLGGSWRSHECHRQRIIKEAHNQPFARPAPTLTNEGMEGVLRAWAARNLLNPAVDEGQEPVRVEASEFTSSYANGEFGLSSRSLSEPMSPLEASTRLLDPNWKPPLTWTPTLSRTFGSSFGSSSSSFASSVPVPLSLEPEQTCKFMCSKVWMPYSPRS